ncbi:DUF5330 domain-containing protein [Rhizobium sp. PP-CC-3G-465]|uniref:DUF5330 domain-containing protein n=1 Tax=Rhizobium sp. PP-CC-3G-465 TaxID=2135648 RepID=UPI0010499513|nr:hypothetical protein C8J33_1011594 [Rhizobium sp. PP-CC-3G-465]
MWFLIKAAFWFSLVLVLLPIFGTEEAAQPQAAAGARMDIGQTVSAASEAIGYISAICLEKPDVCTKGAATFNALGHRAKDGARIAYQLLETQFGDEKTASAGDTVTPGDAVTTGTVPEQALPPAAPSAAAAAEPALSETHEDLGFTRIPVPEKRIPPKPHRAS